jgi:iron complex outermembrane receptor protein
MRTAAYRNIQAVVSNDIKLKATYILLSFGISMMAHPAFAQNPRVLEEVIVTAQKISESVQDVPISLSLVTDEQLKAVNIFDFTETAALTPGVDINVGLQSAAIRVRGVGPDFFAVGSPQSVAVFVDQVAQSQVGAVFSTLVDVERLELLRGPQGTLYGQNAPGGVYNISTRAPNTEKVEGYLETSLSRFDGGTDQATQDVRGAINIPLIEDTLAWRVAGVYRDVDGYVNVANPAASEDTTGGSKAKSIRSRVLWNISDAMSLTWTSNYQDLIDGRALFNYEGQIPGTGGSNPVPRVTGSFKSRDYWGETVSEVRGRIKDSSLHLNWVSSFSNIDILASHQEFNTISDENRNPYFGGGSVFINDFTFRSTTFELRFSGSNDTVRYVTGIYYHDRPNSADIDLVLSGFGVQGGGGGESETYSAFANVNYSFSDEWQLALGLRYDDSTVSTDSRIAIFNGLLNSKVNEEASFDHVSWSAKLRWFATEDILAYFAVDNAFKQGGYNTLVEAANRRIAPVAAQAAQDSLAYDEETSTAFELGVKGKALEGRLQYNAAVFYQEFDDHQISHNGNDALAPFKPLFAGTVTNADKVTTQGVEFDFTYLLGERWELSNRSAYFDATADEWTSRFCNDGESDDVTQVYCPRSDEPLNSLPQWNVNTQLAYETTIGEWNVYSRLDWTWQSKPNITTVTDRYDEAKSRIGFTLGMRSEEKGLDLRVWGKNLSNEDFNIDPGLQRNVGDATQPAAFRGRFYPGRELGITASYKF